MSQIIKMQYYITACSNDAMQYAVLTAFDEASTYPEEMAKEFQARRDLICSRLNSMPGVSCHIPKGAFMFSKGRSSWYEFSRTCY